MPRVVRLPAEENLLHKEADDNKIALSLSWMRFANVPDLRHVDLMDSLSAQPGMFGLNTKRGCDPGMRPCTAYHVVRACVMGRGRASPPATRPPQAVPCMQVVAVGPAST